MTSSTPRADSAAAAVPGRLAGRVAVVTGGGSGIGRAIVERYLREGARVAVLERDRDSAESLRDDHEDQVPVTVGDARDPVAHAEVVASAVDSFGRLDVHVGNAGVYDYGEPFAELAPADLVAAFREIFDTNVLGYLLGAHAAVGALRRTGGSLILTASSSSTLAGGGGALYVGSKHAVAGLVKQLAHEFAPDVRVNAVAPGATRTPLSGVEQLASDQRRLSDQHALLTAIERRVPLGFVSDPEDHAGLYVTLADARDSRFMTGVIIASDGGLGVGGRPRARTVDVTS